MAAVFFACETGLMAQEPAPAKNSVPPADETSRPVRHRSPEAIKKARLKRLQKEIAVTPDQEAKIKPVINTYVDALESVRDDATLDRKSRHQKTAALRAQYEGDLNAVLTEEQRQKLADIKASRLAKRRALREGRSMEPATETTTPGRLAD
jgi:Spy/CpxP family protein refolding chaperone